MKKTLLTILFAAFLGASLSLITIYNLKEELEGDENVVTLFQVGVYKSLDNAKNTQMKHTGAVILQDEGYYRVYIGVAASREFRASLEQYFASKNVNIYPKEVKVTSSYFEECSEYEALLKESNVEVSDVLGSEMLKGLESEVI